MATITQELHDKFKTLCDTYGIPEDVSLLNVLSERISGKPWTTLEMLDDKAPVADLARLLLQLDGEPITVKTSTTRNTYANPATITAVRSAIVEKLRERVARYGDKLILAKGIGSNGFSTVILDHTSGPSDDFTPAELKAIIGEERRFAWKIDTLRGRRSKRSETYTHKPDIGGLASRLLAHLDNEGCDLNTMAKYSFVADFMRLAGFLDFKDETWLDDYEFYTHKEKYDFVKGIIGDK